MSNLSVILCADIGGTNTRLAMFDGLEMRAGSSATYKNEGVAGIEHHLTRYVSEFKAVPDAISLAFAGPVNGTIGKLANLDWVIDAAKISAAFEGTKTVLLNDMQAQGYAVPALKGSSLHVHRKGQHDPYKTTKLVIGIGTGMNISPVFSLPSGDVFVPPSEAGHMRFAPHNPELSKFEEWLSEQLGAPEAEYVLSGRGVRLAYEYISGQKRPSEDVIASAHAKEEDALRAVELVVQALARFAGDMALLHMPTGGIFLIGGAARALEPFFSDLGFEAAFVGNGRYAHLIDATPVYVVHDDFAALSGAALFAVQAINS